MNPKLAQKQRVAKKMQATKTHDARHNKKAQEFLMPRKKTMLTPPKSTTDLNANRLRYVSLFFGATLSICVTAGVLFIIVVLFNDSQIDDSLSTILAWVSIALGLSAGVFATNWYRHKQEKKLVSSAKK